MVVQKIYKRHHQQLTEPSTSQKFMCLRTSGNKGKLGQKLGMLFKYKWIIFNSEKNSFKILRTKRFDLRMRVQFYINLQS